MGSLVHHRGVRIEILNTGSELLIGTTLNTHGAFFGQELLKLGMRVQRQMTVPDGPAIEEALKEAIGRSDVVLVTGGLGPTSDDLTTEATARVLGVELIEDEAALRSLEAFFAKRKKPMAEGNRKQALMPVGADVLPNPNGTAPGVYCPPRLGNAWPCAIFLLPGPPNELKPMFVNEVAPRLVALAGLEKPPAMQMLKFLGVGESDLHDRVDPSLAAIAGLEYGYCARLGEVDVRLLGSEEAVASGRAVMMEAYAKNFVSDDGSPVERVVVAQLKEKGLKLATAESCTGGLIASRVTDVPGSSAVFTHGFVTYANEAKEELLGVSAHALEQHGAVSELVARQMAEGAMRVSGADLALAVTGIAGPDGGSEEKPVGTVYLALAREGKETVVLHLLQPRERLAFKRVVSQWGLDLVRRGLQKIV